jgi:hypothetical protein
MSTNSCSSVPCSWIDSEKPTTTTAGHRIRLSIMDLTVAMQEKYLAEQGQLKKWLDGLPSYVTSPLQKLQRRVGFWSVCLTRYAYPPLR